MAIPLKSINPLREPPPQFKSVPGPSPYKVLSFFVPPLPSPPPAPPTQKEGTDNVDLDGQVLGSDPGEKMSTLWEMSPTPEPAIRCLSLSQPWVSRRAGWLSPFWCSCRQAQCRVGVPAPPGVKPLGPFLHIWKFQVGKRVHRSICLVAPV